MIYILWIISLPNFTTCYIRTYTGRDILGHLSILILKVFISNGLIVLYMLSKVICNYFFKRLTLEKVVYLHLVFNS